MGILRVECAQPENVRYSILRPHYRCPEWDEIEALEHLTLACAVAVRKSQGGEVDTVLMPMTRQFQRMMYRNLLYTAISRARRQVVPYGDRGRSDHASPAQIHAGSQDEDADDESRRWAYRFKRK